jgi:tetratricopeptide (TPR) repeat protein
MELTLDQALKKDFEAHKAGQGQEAERLYAALLTILKDQPKHPDANHHMGLLAVGVGKIKEALPFLKTALETNPNVGQYWLSYIDALVKLDRVSDAKVVFNQAKGKGASGDAFDQLERWLSDPSAHPQDPPPEELQSIINLYTQGQMQQALSESNRMLERFPNSAALHNIAGGSNTALMQIDAAIESYKRALQIKPNYADAYNNMGIALQNKGDSETAIDSFKQALQIKPNYAEAYNNMGTALQDKGDSKAAIDSYEQALKINPDYAEAYNNMSIALRGEGDLEAAITYCKQAIKIKSDYADAYNHMGNILSDKGDLEVAINSFKQATKINPNYAGAYSNMGNALKDKGELEAAIDSFKQALKINPNYAEAYNNMGVALKDKGDSAGAIDSFKQALKIKPDYAEVHDNLGTILKDLGRLEQAEVSCRKAIELKPDFAQAHSNLGLILYFNGDVESALKSMKKSNYINPKLNENTLLLAVLQARKTRGKAEGSINSISNTYPGKELTTNPLILNRLVDRDLIANLYEMNSKELDKTKDARYGNGRCSSGFNLFEDDRPIIKTVAEDLIKIMMEALKSDVYVRDSFFNILGAGGGSTPHNHIKGLDEDHRLNLANQKYSLVYYLSVGDQSCSEPGILKLYDPNEDILPREGMIVIVPAGRQHSAVYGGKKDRVMIGVNFYIL